MRHLIPWYARIAAKLVFSKLPVPYSAWRRINIFGHGFMDKPEYAIGVFNHHFNRCQFARKESGYVALELGPGDSLLSALVAYANGATASYLVDVGAFATAEMSAYHATINLLRAQNKPVPDIRGVVNVQGVLTACNARYFTAGLESLRTLAEGSVDFVYSHAVLEHVRRHQFGALLKQLRRVLRVDGVCSHRIDLTDHLGGQLNNLRIPSTYWEADWVASSGFYTNRLRFSEIVELSAQANFSVEAVDIERWEQLPTPVRSMAKEFQGLTEDDLRIRSFDLVLRPRSSASSYRTPQKKFGQIH